MGFKVAIVSFIIMAAMAGGMYWYYNDTQERMAILVANEANAKIACLLYTSPSPRDRG